MQITEEQPQRANHSDDNSQEFSSKGYHFLGSRTERVVFITLLILLCTGPIIFGHSIPSHADWHIHIERAYNFKRCFWQGQWLPRWVDAQASGYGLAVFNFYAPLVYYLFTFLELFFRDVILSIKWAFIIPIVLTCLTAYLYLRRHSSPLIVTMVMPFVVFSPAIHIYIYNNNWPGSTLAIAFLFLTLYGIDSFDKNKDFDLTSCLIVSFGYSGMALAHLATAYVFTLLAVPYFFFNLFIHKTKKFVRFYASSLILGACLAGFYLFPAALEKNTVRVDEVMTQGPLWDFSKNFLYTYLDRDRDEGYAWAIFDHRYYEISIALFGIIVLISILALLLNMDKVKKYFLEPFRVNAAITMFVISFLMMTPISVFVWLMIKPMHTIQFPWRFISFVLPFGTLIMVYAFDLVGHLAREKINLSGYKFLSYTIMFLLALLVYVDFINMYHWKWVPEQSLLKASINVLWGNEEYRPSLTGDPDWKQYDIRRDFSPSIQSSSSQCDITLLKWLSHERAFQVFSTEDHRIRLRTFYFPGWTVYVDGRQLPIDLDPRLGSIVFDAPAGRHEVKVIFELTPLRKTSTYISLAAFVLFVYLLLKVLRKNGMKLLENRQMATQNKREVEKTSDTTTGMQTS